MFFDGDNLGQFWYKQANSVIIGLTGQRKVICYAGPTFKTTHPEGKNNFVDFLKIENKNP